jgi:16S rRNA processing protein RimM
VGTADRQVLLGKIVGVFGVDGWVKIHSHTEPRLNIFKYQPWTLKSQGWLKEIDRIKGKESGKTLIAQIPEFSNRDLALALIGAEIWVDRSVLPKPRKGSYYWSDLEGLGVHTREGVYLGTVTHLFTTAAHDVLVIGGERERLIPWVMGTFIDSVDLEKKQICVDWDPDF